MFLCLTSWFLFECFCRSFCTEHKATLFFLILAFTEDGIDVRIRGLKIKSSCERDLGLNADVFQSSNLVRYPRLQGTPPDILYRRALVIQR